MAKKSNPERSMTLAEYIASLGDEEFASRYGIKPRTAAAYRLGQRFPKRDVLERIARNSPLTLDGIFPD